MKDKAPKEIHTILRETLACYLPGWAKDLPAPLYCSFVSTGGSYVIYREREKEFHYQLIICQCIYLFPSPVIDRRWHSNIFDAHSSGGADCDIDLYLVARKVRERLAASKQAAQNVDGERFYLRKLNDLEVRKQYQINPLNAELNPIYHLLALLGAHHIFHFSGIRVKIANGFTALENLSHSEDINRAWENN